MSRSQELGKRGKLMDKLTSELERCLNCGATLTADLKFCTECGQSVAGDSSQQAGLVAANRQWRPSIAKNPRLRLVAKRVVVVLVLGSLTWAAIEGFGLYTQKRAIAAGIASVNEFISSDSLDEAKKVLEEQIVKFPGNTELGALTSKLKILIDSKQAFSWGSKYLDEASPSQAIPFLKQVHNSDKLRYATAQEKLKIAGVLYLEQSIARAKTLRQSGNFEEALSTLNEVTAYATASGEYSALKAEVAALAEEQVRKREAAQLAIYKAAVRSMRTKTDKFEEITWYDDRSTPYYANYSTFNLYIGKRSGGDPWLRFKVRYSDDDWLFVRYATVKVDGESYDLDVYDWDTDNGSGDIWEWFDVLPTSSHLDLIDKIIKSRTATVRFYGSSYYDDRTITSSQKRALKNVLNAFEGLKRGLK